MAKLALFLALVASAHCSVVPVSQADDYTSFAYNVDDPITGDYKSQVEARSGDIVQGQYSLLESDGTKCTVDYATDGVNGFNAIIRKDPTVVAAAPALVTSSPSIISSPSIMSSPSITSSPTLTCGRTLAAPSLITSSSAIGAARSLAAPALLASSPNIVSSPALLAGRTLGAPTLVGFSPTISPTRTLAAPSLLGSSPALVARSLSVGGLIGSDSPSLVAAQGYDGSLNTPNMYSAGNVATPYSKGVY